jgi:hypothetical protein
LGEPATGNTPGSRAEGANWADSDGHIWLFGGDGYNTNGDYGLLNELWEFDPSTSEWAWMGGSQTMSCVAYGTQNCGQSGVYGTLGTPASTNIPGGRDAPANWTDSNGNFWLFGGIGFDSVGNREYLDDLWEFDPAQNEWAWMGGPNTAQAGVAVYGDLGVPAAGNLPGRRQEPISWTDSSGNLWLFGGDGFDAKTNIGILNDLWEYGPSTAVTPPKADFSIAVSPVTLTVSGGQSAATTVSITPANGFSAAVSFSCSGLPSGVSCGFSPANVTPAGGAASTSLTVTASSTAAVQSRDRLNLIPLSALAGLFCCLGWRKRPRLQIVLLLALSAVTVLGGCGVFYNPQPVQPVATTVTVTATSGTLQHTTTFSLTVN